MNPLISAILDNSKKTRWRFVAGIGLVTVGLLMVWQMGIWTTNRGGPPTNAIMVIAPYWYNGTWVFDDAKVGLNREPFVAGVPEMIDGIVKDIPDAKQGFRLTFSARRFPGFQKKLTWLRGDSGGNYYQLNDPPVEGWICPAMFQYYRTAPKEIYVRADPARR